MNGLPRLYVDEDAMNHRQCPSKPFHRRAGSAAFSSAQFAARGRVPQSDRVPLIRLSPRLFAPTVPGGQSLRVCLEKAQTLPVGPVNEPATSFASSSASSRPGDSAFHEPMVEYVTVVDSGAIATAAQRGVVPIEKAHAQAIGPVVKTRQQSTEPRPGSFAISLPNPCRAKRKNFFSEFPQNQVDRRGGRYKKRVPNSRFSRTFVSPLTSAAATGIHSWEDWQ